MEVLLKKHPILTDSVVIVVTSIIRALAMTVFYVPNKIAPGGASGIASMVNNYFPNLWFTSTGFVMFAVNVPLIIMAFIFINKIFTLKTLIATALSSLFTDALVWLKIPTFTDDVFVATLGGGICWGIALGFLLKINCSTGGSDIVGLLIQNKFSSAKVVWLIFAFDCLIGIANGIVFKSLALALYSCVAIYCASFIADIVGRGFVSTVELRIISDKHEDIANFVINKLKRSVTAFHGTGMYTKSDKLFMVCIVRKRQAQMVKDKIRELDPNAFFYICNVHEVIGNGFDNTVNPSSKIK